MFGRATIMLGIGPHSSFFFFFPRLISTKARIDNRKKLVKQQYVLQMSPQYGELQPTSG